MFLNIGFSNEWWHTHYGIDFDKELYMNPFKKMSTQDKMDAIMRKEYGDWGFLDNLENTSVLSRPSVGIEPYGHRFIPAMFGSQISYKSDQAPWAQTIALSKEHIMSMSAITEDEFSSHPLVREISRQKYELEKNGIVCSVQQNLGSVMNTAIYLRGMDLFYDFYDEPELVCKLFSLITNMMLTSYDYFSKVDGTKSPLGVGNCSVAMLSPQVYAEFVRPFDQRIMEHARNAAVPFALHQDSLIDAFIPAYKDFNYIHSFDIGCDSDVGLFRSEFPDVDINVFLYTSTLRSFSEVELYDFMLDIATKGAPLNKIGFSVFDIDIEVPQSKIESICKAFAWLKKQECEH